MRRSVFEACHSNQAGFLDCRAERLNASIDPDREWIAAIEYVEHLQYKRSLDAH